jgi:elongation factor G
MEKYLECEEIRVELLKSAIRKATIDVKFFPVLCSDALGDKGTRTLMDAILD